MTQIKKYTLTLIMSLFCLACNDHFLERYPLDNISTETFFNTENDLIAYNNSLYNLARNDDNVPILMGHFEGFDSHWGSIWMQDEFTDNAAPRHDRHDQFQRVRAGKQNVPDSPQRFGFKGWNFVRALNVGLDNYGKAAVTDAIRNKYMAEARLFRGWFYAEKVEKFGDVQWVDHELNIDSEELYASRTPRNEVMDHVLEDLTFASQNLPDDWGDGNAPGRLNRWCALLVKSRVCLFEGTWRKYRNEAGAETWLQEAADAAKELMDNGPYSLYSTGDPLNDYNAFQQALDLSGNPEVMYWRKYKLGIFTNHVLNYFCSYVGGATKSMVEDYLCTDGLPISTSDLYKGDEVFTALFENRDPRLRQSVLHPDDAAKYRYYSGDGLEYPRIQGMPGGGNKSTTGYHIIKNYNADDLIGKAYNTAEMPAIILRFAEALLNYAEAKAELGTLSQSDLDMSINLLRDRVGMPHLMLDNVPVDPRYADDGISPLIVEIRRERRVELFMEGFRYNDLKRWKQGKKLEKKDYGMRWNEAAKAKFPEISIGVGVDPESGKEYLEIYKGTDYENPVFDESKHYLWPIPLSAISQNENIGQNPGW
ncbi:RagB/SusD family nutrient uptake outer membrane protein [Marinilongibacter aquaticus]|uniref:RagB/SusD family nutrient uptake outer membrane protein n=1 Tax=Marinilongibacter aquaticus TaxID=2975157 RepID=UPI0021BD4C31|nr:RagB/SusD family nutrient uptake outer membrane protein [Marinilongibacter aquaticus]UBM57263.1 RagB/SusD family nutrient uptake outer membrane protein [Marinilongibacter aquaticus]